MNGQPKVSKRQAKQWLIAIVVAVLLLPYVSSRVASSSRRVSVHLNPTAKKVNDTSVLTRPLRIACYNIAHGRGTAESNWAGGSGQAKLKRLDEIALLLRTLDADIVVLNEVDFDSSWSHGVNQAAYLADKAGYRYRAEQRNLDFRVLLWTWKFGNAVLSKHPILNATAIDYPCYSSWESWLCGQKRGLVCKIGDQQAVDVFAVHLSHRSELIRVKSVDQLAKLMRESKHPVIAAGDFNSTPPAFPQSVSDSSGDNAIARMPEILQAIPSRVPESPSEMTFHSAKPDRVIDWIFVPRTWKLINQRIEASTLSDHRPLIVDVMPTPSRHL